jgi:transcriptional regulator with XRE-family HTH domain
MTPEQTAALGPTGLRVGRRLAELRRERGLTLSALAAELQLLKRPIILSALSKIEKGQRRVDADDLVALALALDVSPNMLILPDDDSSSDVALTPGRMMAAAAAWQWARRDTPTVGDAGYDFYISAAHADKHWSEWIAWQLEEAGYQVFLPAWDLAPGMNWTQVLADALTRSKTFIAVISPNYLNSPDCAAEWQGALQADSRRSGIRLFPIRVAHADAPKELSKIQYVDLVGASGEEAKFRLLGAIRAVLSGRARPEKAPEFPGKNSQTGRSPEYPELERGPQGRLAAREVAIWAMHNGSRGKSITYRA